VCGIFSQRIYYCFPKQKEKNDIFYKNNFLKGKTTVNVLRKKSHIEKNASFYAHYIGVRSLGEKFLHFMIESNNMRGPVVNWFPTD
jgi:predicted ATPase